MGKFITQFLPHFVLLSPQAHQLGKQDLSTVCKLSTKRHLLSIFKIGFQSIAETFGVFYKLFLLVLKCLRKEKHQQV